MGLACFLVTLLIKLELGDLSSTTTMRYSCLSFQFSEKEHNDDRIAFAVWGLIVIMSKEPFLYLKIYVFAIEIEGY